MKKRFFILLMLACMAFALTACKGKDNDNDNDSDTGAYDKGDVTLGQYKNIEVTMMSTEITDKQVIATIYNELYSNSLGTEVTARNDVREYDLVNIDYTGKKDGVSFAGGTAEGAELLIGSDSFITGFEEGLIGSKVGETVVLNLTFPANYPTASLAGQAVAFDVTINSINAIENVSDEFIAANTDYSTFELYKTSVRDSLETTAEENAEIKFETDVMEAVIANATFNKDLTEEIQAYADYMYSMYESTATQYGIELLDYVYYMSYGSITTLEGFKNQMLVSSEFATKREYAIMAIAEAEGLKVTDDEYDEGCDVYMRQYQFETVEELLTNIGEENIRNALLYDKAVQIIFDSAIVK